MENNSKDILFLILESKNQSTESLYFNGIYKKLKNKNTIYNFFPLSKNKKLYCFNPTKNLKSFEKK